MKLALDNKKEFFKDREITVEMNNKNSHILFKGKPGVKKMEVKNLIVNIVNSLLVLEIKTDVGANKY